MKKTHVLAATVLTACVGQTAVQAPPGPERADSTPDLPQGESAVVTVDLARTHQTLLGFGASVAWYQKTLTQHPKKDEIYRHIFGELGLDILRLRNRFQRSEPDDRDLGVDVEIFDQAKKSLGYAPQLLLTSWSPPAALKKSGQERCKSNDDCTLRSEGEAYDYTGFADYWYDSLAHYASLGLVPDYVSIQNEPSFIPPDWEGCRFEPTETADYPGYDRALAAVHARLGQMSPPPRLLGPEVLGVHWGRPQKYIGAMDTSLVFGIAHHLYERGDDKIWDWRDPGPDSYSDEMRAVVPLVGGKPILQTEFNTDDDNFNEGGFETAWLVHNSLAEENVAAWLYWDLVWDKKGLLSLDGGKYTLRDQYYSLRHYARFTNPGDVRVQADSNSGDVRGTAFLAADRSRLTVVLLNVGRASRHVRVQAGGFVGGEVHAFRTTYRPGSSEVWKPLGSRLELDLPARSVATVVLNAR